MSVSKDPGHFFQTTASLETQARRRLKAGNKNGNPITLPSKILTFVLDPTAPSQRLFTGESGGLARRVDFVVFSPGACVALLTFENGETGYTFRGHGGPVTAVAAYGKTLYTGSWDKTIKVWNVEVIIPAKGSCLIVDSRVSVHVEWTHRFCQVTLFSTFHVAFAFRVHGCLATGLVL
jgi:WD40 repeat protein